MIGRFAARLLSAQLGWARPLGDFNVRWLRALLRPVRPVKDLLHGKWLGHSLHAAMSDVPMGVLTIAILFDLLDLRAAADIAIGVGVVGMVAAAVAGAADYSETDDDARSVATVHATVMLTALVLYVMSLWMRLATPTGDRAIPITIALVAYGVLVSGAWIGGEVVYALGNMVNRHAWRFYGPGKWTKLDIADLAEGVPTAGKAGAQNVVAVREGDQVFVLHAQCAHANGPLAQGRVVDGCIECPWHFSRFDLATGRRKQGPTTFDQPRYDVRAAEGGGYEVRRVGTGNGQNL